MSEYETPPWDNNEPEEPEPENYQPPIRSINWFIAKNMCMKCGSLLLNSHCPCCDLT